MRDFIPNKKRHNSDYFKTIDSKIKSTYMKEQLSF